MDDYILAGAVDLVEGEAPGTVDLVDFKAEAKPDVNDPADQARLERYRRQLDIYARIVSEREGVEVRRAHVHYTVGERGDASYHLAGDAGAAGGDHAGDRRRDPAHPRPRLPSCRPPPQALPSLRPSRLLRRARRGTELSGRHCRTPAGSVTVDGSRPSGGRRGRVSGEGC